MKKFSIYTSGLDKNAFTLAEVLITLGIIGIVAAMTQNTSCAYYAITDTHPTKPGKNYWQDFLGEVYSR